jgi:iron complex transport system ATP-binding protein
MTDALQLAGVSARRGGRLVLDDVSLSVSPGEVLGVVGANGSGKTTLLRAALGLQPLCGGEARLCGRPVATLRESERAALAGYLPQERRAAWNMPAWRIAALGAVDRPPSVARIAALAALEAVGVTRLAERGVLDMSGGERARVLLARLMVTAAPILIADEPTAGLDPDAQLMTLERLRDAAERGAAVIATLHDLTLAVRACDRLAVIAGGRLLALAAPADALTPDVLAAAFALDGGVIKTPAGLVLAARRAR